MKKNNLLTILILLLIYEPDEDHDLQNTLPGKNISEKNKNDGIIPLAPARTAFQKSPFLGM